MARRIEGGHGGWEWVQALVPCLPRPPPPPRILEKGLAPPILHWSMAFIGSLAQRAFQLV